MSASAGGTVDKKPIVAVAAAAAAVAVLYRCWRRSRTVRGVPFAKGHWLLGNLPVLSKAMSENLQHEQFYSWFKENGKTYALSLPMQPTFVCTTDPAIVEHILKTNFDNFVKGDNFYSRLSDILGDGIFAVDGEAWHSQRKIASHMFTSNRFKSHIWNNIKPCSEKLVQILRSTGPGEVVDVFNLMNRFTLDAIGSIGFGRDIGSLQNPDSPFLQSFDTAQRICLKRFFLPMWRTNRLLGTGTEKGASHHFKMLRDYAMETVQLLKQDSSGHTSDSFVGMFIEDGKQHGTPYSDIFLRDMVINFLIAGRDTTAQALSWIFYCLAAHPEVEAKMLKEIKEVVGDGPVTLENTGKLEYVQNVINEGLRLYPSVPNDSKTAVHDDVLPGGIFVPGGTLVQYNMYSMGRSKELWGEDAETFRPERFEGRTLPSSFVYPAFNAGPRECLGKRMAWVEMKACLAEVIRNVHFELTVPLSSIMPDAQLTIGMSTGFPCRVVAR